MTGLKLYVLGSPRLELNDRSVEFERRKALALLIYLAFSTQPLRRDTLATLLWPDLNQTSARAALRRTLFSLSKCLPEGLLHADRESIQLAKAWGNQHLLLDADLFHRLLDDWKHHGHPRSETCPACLRSLAEATNLYQGDFLAGFSLRDAPDFDQWQLFQAETFQRELGEALEQLADGHSAQREFGLAIYYIRRRLALDPFHEPAHCQLMSLYAWSGQRQAALRQYVECARLLERELGVAPQPMTTQLYQTVKNNSLPPLPEQTIQLRTPIFRLEPFAHSQVLVGEHSQPEAHSSSFSMLNRIVRGNLIGREKELALLSDLWNKTLDGEGQSLLVSGEAGVGKTRLVQELVSVAEKSGASVLIGQCDGIDSLPFGPIAQVIRTALDRPDRDTANIPAYILSDLLALAPQLRPRYADVSRNPTLDPIFERQRLFDSFAFWLEILAQNQPFLLLIEDIHWADSETIALLRHLAIQFKNSQLMLVLTYREKEVELMEDQGSQELLLELNRQRNTSFLKVSRLDREASSQLLAAMLATVDISDEFLDRIYEQTEGNPFYIEEVCKALIATGKLYYSGGSWRRIDIQEIQIPDTIRTAIQSRLRKAPAKIQEMLQAAAVLGREFEFATLQKLTGWEEEALIPALEDSQDYQILEEVQRSGSVRFAFVHALIPFALRESLSGMRVQQLHRRAARVFEDQRPDDYETLSHHFTAAGEWEAAIRYNLLAAQRARSLYASDSAIQKFQAVLQLLGLTKEQPGQRRQVLEQYGDTLQLRSQFAEAVLSYQEALALWEKEVDADPMIKVRLLCKIGETVFGTEWIKEVQPYQAAALAGLREWDRLMEVKTAQPETVRLLICLSQAAWRSSSPQDWDTAERYARSAVEKAESLNDMVVLSNALDALSIVYVVRGLFRERVSIALRRAELSRRPDLQGSREQAHNLNETGVAMIDVGEYAQALPYLLTAENLASQIHAIDELVYALRLQATCAFRLDRWDDVIMVEKLRDLQQRHPRESLHPQCFHLALMSCVLTQRGEKERGVQLRDESLADMYSGEPVEAWWRPQNY
jgi:DNA-binding SARP family transcriptional activator/tetratricopeptide (TPR) repeat protein